MHETLIPRSAWKGNSANFAITEFSEVRALHLCSRAHTLVSHRSMLRSLRGQLGPREGAGQLPALLLYLGPLPHQLPAARQESRAGSSARRKGVQAMSTNQPIASGATTTSVSQGISGMRIRSPLGLLAALAFLVGVPISFGWQILFG